MATRSGIQIFLDLLAEFKVRYIFGNPGTTELPLNDELVSDHRLKYLLGLQEVPVMSMADGFSMASGELGVVNLHISCGLGNAMGMLYNAFREGTPLLVTAGQQDRRLAFEEPILGGDMVAVARSWTKWSVEVNRIQDLPTAIRRAVQLALTPPTGPVFLSLPVDVQMELIDESEVNLSPITVPDLRVRPPLAAVEKAVDRLMDAQNPAILAGSRVVERGATDALVQLAEALGVPVYAESGTTHGRLPFPTDHPLYGPGLPLWSPEIQERLKPHDTVFAVGMDVFRQYVYHEPACPIPDTTEIIHLDESPWELGKNYHTPIGLIGDLRAGLHALVQRLEQCVNEEQRSRFTARAAKWAEIHQANRARLVEAIEQQKDARPLTPLGIMSTVASVLPDNAAIIEEAVTTTNTTIERLGALKNTTGYFGHRGWTLGWGLGCTLGAQLAWPDRPVLGILGEGASLYGIQGLWSAARYKIPATFLICNNAQYQILKIGAKGLQLPHAINNEYEGLDISGPEVDIVSIAQAFGVDAVRVQEPDQLADELKTSFASDTPKLIDVPISRETQSRLNYG